jgi:hypothetical protein
MSLSNSLTKTPSSGLLAFLNGPDGGDFTGLLFTVSVPAGTPPDFYRFASDGGGFAEFGLEAAPLEGGLPVSALENFSVLVTGAGVADGGSAVMLLGVAFSALGIARRFIMS